MDPRLRSCIALIFWASVETKRHTPKEFILGTVCLLIAAGVSALVML